MTLTRGLPGRYAITDTSADWSAAEAQVAKLGDGGGKSTLVSVKTAAAAGTGAGAGAGKKRKAEEADAKGGEKKSRRSMKGKGRH